VNPTQPYDVFLSHSHADAAWIERLAAKLAWDESQQSIKEAV